MTATITLSCDGHRHGSTCRGALQTRHWNPEDARQMTGHDAGWRRVFDHAAGRRIDLCPARGHDEEPVTPELRGHR